MTGDEIIDLAIEAGASVDGASTWDERLILRGDVELIEFARLVAARAAAEEREACATTCEEVSASPGVAFGDGEEYAMRCADRIRARGDV